MQIEFVIFMFFLHIPIFGHQFFRQSIEFFPLYFVIRTILFDQVPKCLRVVHILNVRQLVNHDRIYGLAVRHNQPPRKIDALL